MSTARHVSRLGTRAAGVVWSRNNRERRRVTGIAPNSCAPRSVIDTREQSRGFSRDAETIRATILFTTSFRGRPSGDERFYLVRYVGRADFTASRWIDGFIGTRSRRIAQESAFASRLEIHFRDVSRAKYERSFPPEKILAMCEA